MSDLSDVICLSHLRWDFVFQRPNHLMSRCAREARTFFFEEPIFVEGDVGGGLEVSEPEPNLWRVVPRLPRALDRAHQTRSLKGLFDQLIDRCHIDPTVLWYYTPMALEFTGHVQPKLMIYDCMDELANFKGAPTELKEQERDLFRRADLVFTGGYTLYEAKRDRHPNVHPFPSSVDTAHFGRARGGAPDPRDQAIIPHPRLGFYGVIDERMDLALLDQLATLRPDWQIVMIGPVVKIEEGALPRHPNLHYLGKKDYAELPAYLGGWEVAIMPFAINDATRFISPTKTLEYLAGGRPVVSTPVRDVVRPYEDLGLVRIGHDVANFARAVDETLAEVRHGRAAKIAEVDQFLRDISWDRTWARMTELMYETLRKKLLVRPAEHAAGAGEYEAAGGYAE